jgi:dolichyl-phosphate-mannose-protein mannosyltransferase
MALPPDEGSLRASATIARSQSRLVAVVLASVLVVGLAVRLYGLEFRTLTHPESYVPRIELPDYARTPPARHTFWALMEGTLLYDNHPPAYYLFMWIWTFLAGTGLSALRLPSALIGTATVGLLFVVARRRYGLAVALIAAALLALHGHHIFWSQAARMWVVITFLGVWSVSLLQGLARHWRIGDAVGYAVVSALGLWTEYYYWPFFFAQVLWALFQDAHPTRPSRLVGAQMLALVLSAPALIILRIQMGIQVNYLNPRGLPSLIETLEFARLYPGVFFRNHGGVGAVAFYGLAGAGALLLVASIMHERAPSPLEARNDESGHGHRVLLGLQAASALVVSVLVALGQPLWGSAKRVAIGCALTWLPVAAWWIAGRTWRLWSRALERVRGWRVSELILADLTRVQVLAPLAALFLLSLRTPVAVARGLLLFAPLLLVLMVDGVFRLTGRSLLRGAMCLALLLLSLGSAYHYSRLPAGGPEYQALARAVIPRVQDNDLVVVENAWWAEPMHYYMPPGRFRLVEPGALQRRLETEDRCSPSRPSRIWVVGFNHPVPRTVDENLTRAATTLRDYALTWRTSADGTGAALFEHRADGCPA